MFMMGKNTKTQYIIYLLKKSQKYRYSVLFLFVKYNIQISSIILSPS